MKVHSPHYLTWRITYIIRMKNDSLKIVLIVAVIAIAGYFLYTNFAKTDAGQQGAVISGTSNAGKMICEPNPSGTYPTTGNGCKIITSTCAEISGTYTTGYDTSGNPVTTCVPNSSMQNGSGTISTGTLKPATATTTVKTTTK